MFLTKLFSAKPVEITVCFSENELVKITKSWRRSRSLLRSIKDKLKKAIKKTSKKALGEPELERVLNWREQNAIAAFQFNIKRRYNITDSLSPKEVSLVLAMWRQVRMERACSIVEMDIGELSWAEEGLITAIYRELYDEHDEANDDDDLESVDIVCGEEIKESPLRNSTSLFRLLGA